MHVLKCSNKNVKSLLLLIDVKNKKDYLFVSTINNIRTMIVPSFLGFFIRSLSGYLKNSLVIPKLNDESLLILETALELNPWPFAPRGATYVRIYSTLKYNGTHFIVVHWQCMMYVSLRRVTKRSEIIPLVYWKGDEYVKIKGHIDASELTDRLVDQRTGYTLHQYSYTFEIYSTVECTPLSTTFHKNNIKLNKLKE